jgi:hypothetical protein
MSGHNAYHSFEHEGKTYRFVYDTMHQTRGSYGYDTEEETKAAEDEEIEKLNSGEWVVLGCIVSVPCPGAQKDSMSEAAHCTSCDGREELDSLWGIVVENSDKAVEEFVKNGGI